MDFRETVNTTPTAYLWDIVPILLRILPCAAQLCVTTGGAVDSENQQMLSPPLLSGIARFPCLSGRGVSGGLSICAPASYLFSGRAQTFYLVFAVWLGRGLRARLRVPGVDDGP